MNIDTRLRRMEQRDARARQRARGECPACGGLGRWILIDPEAPEPPFASGGCPACGRGGVLRRSDEPQRYIKTCTHPGAGAGAGAEPGAGASP
jgi:hypothetical protein